MVQLVLIKSAVLNDYFGTWTNESVKDKTSFNLWERDEATGPDYKLTMSSANGLVGTGIASRYRVQPRVIFKRPNG